MSQNVLVSDFDGTMTANEFYLLVAERVLPADALTPWEDYRAGKITHFTALQRIFGRIRTSEEELEALARDMQPDPGLADALQRLHRAGWEVVVASAGCDWYIRRILKMIGVTLKVYSNPGVYDPSNGSLRMRMPPDSPFTCAETGVDKAALVRFYREQGATVAFAGDGYPDLPAALEVPESMRFARNALVEALEKQGESYRPFTVWSDVAEGILTEGEYP
ncbi:HAD-IB family phosphatase [Desulfovibrio inopinatus]|uniref:HAD-IB family phosphatase n=1 Tax=Desulfovibrio inopinatus TaxID=102109 RepID=UPI0004178331|nr:HAD-IB family phosphatase [Desulfovibrio inopinatus]